MDPVYPVAPLAPVGPVLPIVPLAPVAPVTLDPVAPVTPFEPAGPVAPVLTAVPGAPVEPVDPVGPVGPVPFAATTCSAEISLLAVLNAAAMLAKLSRKPTLSLLIPGTGKLTLMPLMFILEVMVHYVLCIV